MDRHLVLAGGEDVKESSIHLTALALLVLFGANWVLFGCLWLHERLASCRDAARVLALHGAELTPSAVGASGGGGGHGKVLSEPLSRSLGSVRMFSRDVARLGVVITFAYLCEHHPLFPHSKKFHDMDMFWCVALILLIASALNVRKSKGGDVLNREQTEEWKGWMQFMFLMYHYFSAHEVYNSIRVFITAYVWMTGFGNFSFFYLKGDFGAVRLLQMLWRLNFLVLFLCMAMKNHYILYYICPLHTFYFFVVYAIMFPVRSANYTENGMRVKLLVAGAIIFCVWDWDLKIFEQMFFFLGREKVVGAEWGTMWEWYFRTSLDHWSTFLGMIFALNYPATVQWVKKVEALPLKRQWLVKGSVAAVLLSVTAWWAANILPMGKLGYNQKNAYFGVAVPVLTYIYVRNLSPLLRTRYLEPLHSLGKITLETYLMQHHIWLTSNAKTLLVVLPGLPKLNMVVVSVVYVLLSRELYRLTMSLRGMCLPDNLSACLRNLAGIAGAFAAAMGIAKGLIATGASPFAAVVAIASVGFGVAFAVHRMLASSGSSSGGSFGLVTAEEAVAGGDGDISSAASAGGAGGKKGYDGRLLSVQHTGPVLGVVGAVLVGSLCLVNSSSASTGGGASNFPQDICVEAANHGMWKVEAGKCAERSEALAYCNSHEWKWVDVPDQCHLHYMPPSEVKGVLKGLQISIVGDSVERFVYHALVRSYGEATPLAHDTSVEKHSDFLWQADDGTDTSIKFLWAPVSAELNTRVAKEFLEETPDVLLMGGGLWDALYSGDDTEGYVKGINMLRQTLANASSNIEMSPATMWVSMTNVVTNRLLTKEKKEALTEPRLKAYKEVVDSSGLLQEVDGVIDGIKLTTGQLRESYDGVHYSDLTYDAFAQVAVNLITHFQRTGTIGAAASEASEENKLSAKEIVGMGNVPLALILLFLASVMVLRRDAFHGMPRLALTTFGGRNFDASSMTWEDTYGDLLRKIGKHPYDSGSGLQQDSGGGGSGRNSPLRPGQGRKDGGRSGSLDDKGAGPGAGGDGYDTTKALLDGEEGNGSGGRSLEMSAASCGSNMRQF